MSNSLDLPTVWEQADKKLMPTEISLLADNAEAVLRGYQTMKPTPPHPTQIVGYHPYGYFHVRVRDGDDWHSFLLQQQEDGFCTRYIGAEEQKNGSALGSPSLPGNDVLKALGMARTEAQQKAGDGNPGYFRFDTHFCTIASVIGFANLVQNQLDDRQEIARVMAGQAESLWLNILACGQPVLLLPDETLPKRFVQYLPKDQPPLVLELQRTDCDFTCKMVVYKKDDYWRAQYLEQIQKWFGEEAA